jgi:hypothetical protein
MSWQSGAGMSLGILMRRSRLNHVLNTTALASVSRQLRTLIPFYSYPATITFMLKPVSRVLHALLFLVLVGTLGGIVYSIKTGADARWSRLQPGLERRVIQIYDDQNQEVESLYIWRIDQNYFRMDVAYAESPKSLQTWQEETNAAIVVNGGYFSIENQRYFPDGLTIVNGRAFGSSFEGYGGMLAIHQDQAELRWLVQKPYDSQEPLQAALQSFPILVQPGGRLGFGPENEDNAKARRTVIGQDKNGRILLIVAPEGYFSLHELSAYLTQSDLDLDIAVNLDGGGSTGILVANPREIIPSKVLLPFVILVYAR